MCSQLDRSIATLATLLLCSAGLAGCVDAHTASEDTDHAEDALSTSKCPDFNGDTSITPPEEARLWFALHAVGVQIYTCNETGSWVFQAPEAVLLNNGDQEVGIHYAGPRWELGDGSIVLAALVPPIYTPDPDAIPWLLLRAVENTGHGRLKDVTYIQRLNTTGGTAPTSACDAGEEARVDYTADYFFYREGHGNPGGNPRCGG